MDTTSLAVLEKADASYKVASADLTNLPLIGKIAETGKPLILSTGMSRRHEVETAANFLNARKAGSPCLQQCQPAPFDVT